MPTNDALEMPNPFGEPDCNTEMNIFKDRYSDLFFHEAPFNIPALQRDKYLIVGRRGTGKTSLTRFFSFQTEIKNAHCIYVDQPAAYDEVLRKLADQPDQPDAVAIPRIRKVWEFLFWTLLFERYGHSSDNADLPYHYRDKGPSGLIQATLDRLIELFLDGGRPAPPRDLDQFLASGAWDRKKEAVREAARRAPTVLALDSLEHYDVGNAAVMRCVSALVSAGHQFNTSESKSGIFVKVLLSGEVFPQLLETFIENPGKIGPPLWLHWRPKDLIRLVCWRFYNYLANYNQSELGEVHIDWNNFTDVKDKVWSPFFGSKVTNRIGIVEDSFAYILRHTQMRPRQLVFLCNQIALQAREVRSFPHFSHIVQEAVRQSEDWNSTDVINAYIKTYPNASSIISKGLGGLPKIFDGNELDIAAPRSAGAWPKGSYSPDAFRQLVAELGIVGRVRKYDEKSGFTEADFEYFLERRLALNERDTCVIHPMFYQRLQTTEGKRKAITYPFPDHPDSSNVRPGN